MCLLTDKVDKAVIEEGDKLKVRTVKRTLVMKVMLRVMDSPLIQKIINVEQI